MRRPHVLGAALALALLAGCGGEAAPPSSVDVRAAQRAVRIRCTGPAAPSPGLPLTGLARDKRRVTFVYGTCKPTGDSGCATPLQIQTSSICDRNTLLVDVRPRASTRARGIVVRHDGEGDLALDVGESNVTVFARSPYRERVLPALRQVVGGPSDGDLPRARYPLAYVAELRRVREAHRRLGNVRAVRDELGISQSAVRLRLALARELGSRRLRSTTADHAPGRCALEPARWFSTSP